MSKKEAVNIEKLKIFFEKDPNVVFANLFGSSANGIVSQGSDLDIAVLFKDPPSPGKEYLNYYYKLCDVIPEVEVVDFVNLNEANVILAFEALKGTTLCKNDPYKTAGFFSLVCREYEDVMGNLEHQKRLRKEAS